MQSLRQGYHPSRILDNTSSSKRRCLKHRGLEQICSPTSSLRLVFRSRLCFKRIVILMPSRCVQM